MTRRNFCTVDIVIHKAAADRNDQRLARVINIYNDTNGYLQNVQLYIGAVDENKLASRVLVRPVHKIVLFAESSYKAQTPTEKP